MENLHDVSPNSTQSVVSEFRDNDIVPFNY